jgi:hypothetical protein
MSNWLDPDWARAAIATATPATGTGSAADAAPDGVDPAALDGVAAAKAVKPRFGTPATSALAAPLPLCAFAVAAVRDADVAETSVARALARSVLAGAAGSDGLDATVLVSLACAGAGVCWMTLPAACVLPAVTAEADASLSPPLSVVADADTWFAGAASLVSDVGAPSCAVTVAVAGLVGRLVASPIAAVAALTVLTGVGGLTGGATVIAAATGCGGLAAAIAAAAVAGSVVAAPLLLLLLSLLPALDDALAGVAGAATMTWVGSAGLTLSVPAGSAWELGLLGRFAALAAAPLGACGPVLPAVDAGDGFFPPLAAGGLAAPGCAAAAAVLPIGVAAGSAFGLTAGGLAEAWPCDGVPPAFVGAEFVEPVFVDPAFAGAGFADAELVGVGFAGAGFVGAEFVGAEFDDAEFAGAGLVGAGFAGAGLAAGDGFTGAVGVSGALVASSNAANGWESVCSAGRAGASACDHCDGAKDDVELTSDAILDTAEPLQSES